MPGTKEGGLDADQTMQGSIFMDIKLENLC